jgi:hypothetical protein
MSMSQLIPVRLLLFAAATFVSPIEQHAQTLELEPGAKVRVVAPALWAARYQATIGARRGDTLSLVRQKAAPIDVPLGSVTRIDVSRGRSRRAGAIRGIVWGAGVGVALGLVNATGYGRDPTTGCRTIACGPNIFADGASFVFGGTLWGAGIGAIAGRESWQRVINPLASAPSR